MLAILSSQASSTSFASYIGQLVICKQQSEIVVYILVKQPFRMIFRHRIPRESVAQLCIIQMIGRYSCQKSSKLLLVEQLHVSIYAFKGSLIAREAYMDYIGMCFSAVLVILTILVINKVWFAL